MKNILEIDFNKKLDLITLGRAGIDLMPNEINRPMEETQTFTKYVGGSPANICVAANKLKLNTGFIGRVSDDQHGRFIRNYFNGIGVDTQGLITDESGYLSGLAFVEVKSPDSCGLIMYRENAVDIKLEPKDIDESHVASSKILLISGTALADSPSREAVFTALEYAKRNGTIVFFDLDYRPYTWRNNQETAIYYRLAAKQSDVVIGTRDEYDQLEWPDKNEDANTARYFIEKGTKIVIIKHGKQGSYAYTKEEVVKGKVFPIKPLKTFGAGDSYAGGLIYGILNGKSMQESMAIGAAAAAIVVSQNSCSEAMPSIEEINTFIENYKG